MEQSNFCQVCRDIIPNEENFFDSEICVFCDSEF